MSREIFRVSCKAVNLPETVRLVLERILRQPVWWTVGERWRSRCFRVSVTPLQNSRQVWGNRGWRRKILGPGTQSSSKALLMVTRASVGLCCLFLDARNLFWVQIKIGWWKGRHRYTARAHFPAWTPPYWCGQLLAFHTASPSVLEPHLQIKIKMSNQDGLKSKYTILHYSFITWILLSGSSVSAASLSRSVMSGYGVIMKARSSSDSCARLKIVLFLFLCPSAWKVLSSSGEDSVCLVVTSKNQSHLFSKVLSEIRP